MSAHFDEIPFVSTDRPRRAPRQSRLAIVDGPWHLPPTGRQWRGRICRRAYSRRGSVNIDTWVYPSSGLPHMLPSEAMFAELAGKAGISNDATIVV